MYVNGIETLNTNTSQWTGDISPSHVTTIGGHSTAATYPFNGMMADFQVWNELWTQSDATFDYLNPESLALNNSGTSLTESNLKLWYPMQDGHRGQQSYVLDGANTGLGDEMITSNLDSQFDEMNTDSNNTVTYPTATSARITTTDGASVGIRDADLLTAGVTYKCVIDTTIHSGVGIKIQDNSAQHQLIETTGIYTFYFKANDSYLYVFRRNANPTDFTINSLSIKPVNDKHHATTEFYGDNLIGTGDKCTFESGIESWSNQDATLSNPADLYGSELISNNTFDSDTTGWTPGSNANLSITTGNAGDSGEALKILENSGANPFAFEDVTCVIGQSYQWTFKHKDIDSTGVKPQYGVKDTNSNSYIIGPTTVSSITTGSWTTETIRFKATHTTMRIYVWHAVGSGAGTAFYFDTMSLKELNTHEASDGALKIVASGTHYDNGYKSFTTVAGRTYYVDGWVMKKNQSSRNWTWRVGTATDATDLIANQDSTTYDVWVNITGTFTATSATSYLVIIPNNGASTTDTIYVDNISVKEVGVASGWTNADQQLDIPQTALQSYNQLAWFGENDAEKISCGSDSSIDTIWAGGGTASAWFYAHDEGNGTYGRVIDKVDWYIMLSNVSGSTCTLTFKHNCTGTNVNWRSSSTVIEFGKWYHVAVAWNSDSVTNTPAMYLNGELVTASNVDGTASGDLTSEATDNLTIGNTNAGTRTFNGCITEVSMWNDLFTQAEVNELYNDGKALYAKDHSAWSLTNLKGYWQNNGLATWTDLGNYGNDGSVDASVTETLLLPAGVDASRDNQGFIMNRQKDTNSLNLARVNSDPESSPFVMVRTNPLYTGSVVTKASVSAWVKFLRLPQHTDKAHIFDSRITNEDASFMFWMDASNVLQFRFYSNNSSTFKYVSHDLDTDVGGVGYDASEEFVVDKWIHLTATFETLASDTNMHLYANAKLIAGGVNHYTDAWSLHAAGDSAVSIGANLENSSIPAIKDEYVGNYVIDDALIYRDKALSADEVTRNYKAGKRSHR
jgi:hypothetical protein